MLKHLYIQNYIIIEKLNIDFESGMSVFTGETGAGKSIIIDALGLLCGDKGSPKIIQTGADKAYVEAVFEISNPKSLKRLQEAEFEDENEYIFSRTFTLDGKSTTKINHRTVTYSFMKEVLSFELDIHSQHDTQYLLNSKSHISLLDAFINNEVLFNKMKADYKVYAELNKNFSEKSNTDFNAEDEEYIRFQIDEITDADLKENEDIELEERQKELSLFTKINETMTQVLENMSEVDEKYYSSIKQLDSLSSINELNDIHVSLKEKYYETQDLVSSLHRYTENLEFDEDQYHAIQERLFLISKLKRKYGHSIEAILSKKDELVQRLEMIENRQLYLEKMEKEVFIAKENAMKTAKEINRLREKYSKVLVKEVSDNLTDLMLPHALFSIEIKDTNLSSFGCDSVEFYISTNKGESLKPLASTASGGELSRFMLGIKVVFSLLQGISTIIFDEVDSGVSGVVASAIGKKMKHLSTSLQVLSITHIAQVAACADKHYFVYKDQSSDKTITSIKLIDSDDRIKELAMISSGSNSESALIAAKELFDSHQ